VVANFIHRLSPRAGRPMVRVNCAALPETLMESELFGHARGSFTGASRDRSGLFQAADGGTIFLDEVGEIPTALQPKLLRVLQDGTFHRLGDSRETVSADVRVIAATNRDLDRAVEAGTFRSDLYYRLAVIPIEVPPLRDRIEALPELVDRLMERVGAARGLKFSKSAMEAMRRYPWPGNVRELANAVEYAVVLGEPPEIGIEGLPVAIQDHERRLQSGEPLESPRAETLEDIEMRCIVQAMERTGYNRTRAAQLLGITRRTLGYRINKYGLTDRLEQAQTALAASGHARVRKVRRRTSVSQDARA